MTQTIVFVSLYMKLIYSPIDHVCPCVCVCLCAQTLCMYISTKVLQNSYQFHGFINHIIPYISLYRVLYVRGKEQRFNVETSGNDIHFKLPASICVSPLCYTGIWRMNSCVFLCIRTCTLACLCSCVLMWEYMSMYGCIFVFIDVYVCVSLCVCIITCVRVPLYVCPYMFA